MRSRNPITVSVDGHVSCRLYSDTRPHCLEIAPLQKGLVLVLNGKELIGEGVGFGAPVVVYRDRPYFSTSAEVARAEVIGKPLLSIIPRFLVNVANATFWKK